MDFGLSQDQVLLKDTIRRWLEAECPPPRVRAIMESPAGHDPALWEGLAALGVAGLHVPVAHGGSGLELLDVALAAEELGWACTPGPFLACALATAALVAGGTDEAQARWLPAIAHGRARGNGQMPAQIYTGRDADDVASFVAKAVGTSKAAGG